jgi:hypothetical protein
VPTASPEHEPGPDLLVWFAAGNLVLVPVGLLLFWWGRRRARVDPIRLLDEDESPPTPEAAGAPPADGREAA